MTIETIPRTMSVVIYLGAIFLVTLMVVGFVFFGLNEKLETHNTLLYINKNKLINCLSYENAVGKTLYLDYSKLNNDYITKCSNTGVNIDIFENFNKDSILKLRSNKELSSRSVLCDVKETRFKCLRTNEFYPVVKDKEILNLFFKIELVGENVL